ncbi:MAG: hypothetical protein ACR2P5_08505 [Gammaproteobacteria bacterium]
MHTGGVPPPLAFAAELAFAVSRLNLPFRRHSCESRNPVSLIFAARQNWAKAKTQSP